MLSLIRLLLFSYLRYNKWCAHGERCKYAHSEKELRVWKSLSETTDVQMTSVTSTESSVIKRLCWELRHALSNKNYLQVYLLKLCGCVIQ